MKQKKWIPIMILGIIIGTSGSWTVKSMADTVSPLYDSGYDTEINKDPVNTDENQNPNNNEGNTSLQKPGSNNIGSNGTAEKLPSSDKEHDKNVFVSNVIISGISNKIAAGKKITLETIVNPNNAANKTLRWSSSNNKIATVSQSGVVKIKKKTGGKSVIIMAEATDGSGVKAAYKIRSMKGVVKKIAIKGSKTVKAGKSVTLKATVKATKGANKKIKWISSNPSYASVSASGKVTTKKEAKGKKVKITAMAKDGSNKKSTITLKIK